MSATTAPPPASLPSSAPGPSSAPTAPITVVKAEIAAPSATPSQASPAPGATTAPAPAPVKAETTKGGAKSKGKGSSSSNAQGGDKPDGQKENTVGRWTSEEHALFLKGLEMHGKGWKKIAKLIKTRTVVQIRTHAQKYFQRMAKAKKNGQHDLLMDGRPFGKRRGRRRLLVMGPDGQPAISALLKPYLSAGAVTEETVERGLYRFLSPMVMDEEVGGLDKLAGDGNVQMPVDPPPESMKIDPDLPAPEPPPLINKVMPDMYDKAGVPDWYRRGADVGELLNAAAGLDWTADTGGEVQPGSLKIPPAPPAEGSGEQGQEQQQGGGSAPSNSSKSKAGGASKLAPAVVNAMDTSSTFPTTHGSLAHMMDKTPMMTLEPLLTHGADDGGGHHHGLNEDDLLSALDDDIGIPFDDLAPDDIGLMDDHDDHLHGIHF